MHLAYLLVTILAAAFIAVAVVIDLVRTDWIHDNMAQYGVSAPLILPLGVVRTSGGIGLLLGIWLPWLGVLAGAGLVLYFLGALFVIARSKMFSHLQYPAPFLLVSAAALALRLLTL